MPDHRILIVEDETKLAASIQKGLSENGLEAEIAYDGETGKRMFTNEQYDLVVLDINLPHINGFDLCRHFRQTRPRLPIIMLTALGSLDDKLNAFAEGADDYLVKPFHFKELLARVSALLKRAGNMPVTTGNTIQVADLEMNTDQKTVTRSGQAIDLTAREFALLELLARNKGRVLSKNEIMEKVWDLHFQTQSNVVEVYINFLRNKVDKPYTQKLIHTRTGLGYYLKEQP